MERHRYPDRRSHLQRRVLEVNRSQMPICIGSWTMGDANACLGQLGNVGIIEMHHVHQNSAWSEKANKFPIRHCYMRLGFKEIPISSHLGAVYCCFDSFSLPMVVISLYTLSESLQPSQLMHCS